MGGPHVTCPGSRGLSGPPAQPPTGAPQPSDRADPPKHKPAATRRGHEARFRRLLPDPQHQARALGRKQAGHPQQAAAGPELAAGCVSCSHRKQQQQPHRESRRPADHVPPAAVPPPPRPRLRCSQMRRAVWRAPGGTHVPVLLPPVVVVQEVLGSVQHHRPVLERHGASHGRCRCYRLPQVRRDPS